MNKPIIKAFHDSSTGTISYVVEDPKTKNCAVIDSVLDFDISSGRTSTKNADEIIEFIKCNKLNLEWIIETHVHADHLSAAPYIQDKIGGKIGIGEAIILVQDTFGKIFNAGTENLKILEVAEKVKHVVQKRLNISNIEIFYVLVDKLSIPDRYREKIKRHFYQIIEMIYMS